MILQLYVISDIVLTFFDLRHIMHYIVINEYEHWIHCKAANLLRELSTGMADKAESNEEECCP